MFIRYFVVMDHPYDVIEPALTAAPETWIPGLAGAADDAGQLLLAEVGFGKVLRFDHSVTISLGDPVRLEGKALVPIKWTPAGESTSLPVLEGDLEVAELGPRRAVLSMTASYVPPFGLLGRLADRALLHRVAEATVKDFLDRVKEGLATRTSGPGAVVPA